MLIAKKIKYFQVKPAVAFVVLKLFSYQHLGLLSLLLKHVEAIAQSVRFKICMQSFLLFSSLSIIVFFRVKAPKASVMTPGLEAPVLRSSRSLARRCGFTVFLLFTSHLIYQSIPGLSEQILLFQSYFFRIFTSSKAKTHI